MLNQSVVELIEISKELHDQIGNKIADAVTISHEDKVLIPATCFDIVREYQAAMIVLIEKNLYHSAYVLARSTFETFIRGAWFKNCANLEQINNFKQNNNPPSIRCLISNLEETPLYTNKILSTIYEKNWGVFCSFTHTGYEHIISRYKDELIQSNHSGEEISRLVNFINTLTLLASIETASLAENKELEEEFYSKLEGMYEK